MSILRNEKADWVKVLEVMYENQLSASIKEIHNDDKYSEFANPERADRLEKLAVLNRELHDEIGADNIDNSIQYLKEIGLISEIGPKEEQEFEFPNGTISSKPSFSLNESGLELAHQIKTERQRRFTNLLLVVLTAVLTVLTIGLFVVEVLPLL